MLFRSWLSHKLSWAQWQRRPPRQLAGWGRADLRAARRVLCGHVATTGCEKANSSRELRAAVTEMAEAGAALMQRAHDACVEQLVEAVRQLDHELRVGRKLVRLLRARVRDGGPDRANVLRELDSVDGRVRTR